jgi:exosome complex component RRP41
MSLLIKDEAPEKLIREDGKRLDGRDLNELRPIKMEVGVIPNADGSAYIEWGGNKIFAAVYGPREVHPRHDARPDKGILRIYYRMTTYSVHERKRPAPSRREKEISMVITDAIEPILFLELYPDSAIEVYIEVISADGGTRCASTTVAVLALADAGIPMRSLISSVAIGKADGKLVLDISGDEDKAGEADLPCAITWYNNEISLLQFDGMIDLEEFDKCLELAKDALEKIHAMQKEALKKRYIDIKNNINSIEQENQNGVNKK